MKVVASDMVLNILRHEFKGASIDELNELADNLIGKSRLVRRVKHVKKGTGS